jgi:hypothetical protein
MKNAPLESGFVHRLICSESIVWFDKRDEGQSFWCFCSCIKGNVNLTWTNLYLVGESYISAEYKDEADL